MCRVNCKVLLGIGAAVRVQARAVSRSRGTPMVEVVSALP